MKNKNIIFYLTAIPLLCLVIVQICLRNPKTRELFTDIEKYENINYTSNYDRNKFTVELSLLDGTPGENIGIFYNGNFVESFIFTTMSVSFECDGVIQIKNDSSQNLCVSVNAVTPNITVVQPKTYAGIGISNLCRVIISE